jgi:hypothetical protein
MQIKAIEILYSDIKSTISSKLDKKSENPLIDMIYCISHLHKFLNNSNVHTTKMIDYLENILINRLYEDAMEI